MNFTEAPLAIENGTFSWGDGEAVLKNINLEVKKNNLVAVVGTVGAGKSSLISAFLGEMDKLSGRVNTVGTVAYVSQQAWIQNASLQDNILFGKPMDRKRYNQVIAACALKPDIDMLPGRIEYFPFNSREEKKTQQKILFYFERWRCN